MSDTEQSLDSREVEGLLVRDNPAAKDALDAFVAQWQTTEHPGISTVLARIVDPLVIEPMMKEPNSEELAQFLKLVEAFLERGDHDVAMFVTYDLLEALVTNRNWSADCERQLGPLTEGALLKLRQLRGEAT